MNEETLVIVDSLVSERGTMTIMAGNMAASRQAVTLEPERELTPHLQVGDGEGQDRDWAC